ncbi:hypothetical protein [Streptomyces asiaticus]|uniref:hypothetical protein n=1 Tax=Streptomyces asiaticus TaxID=114695 RepID=UPI003F674A71
MTNLLLVGDHCPTCGHHVDDPEEAGAYYCWDCDRYINPLPGSALQAELDHTIETAPQIKADWCRAQFRLITGEAS